MVFKMGAAMGKIKILRLFLARNLLVDEAKTSPALGLGQRVGGVERGAGCTSKPGVDGVGSSS